MQYFVIVWPTVLTSMGVACFLNARRCGRIHCYFTGPLFLVLAGIGLLYGLGARVDLRSLPIVVKPL